MNLATWLGKESFGLTMSSGFFGFFAHTGVMSVLEEENLLPTRISGSSAGALVGGAWAAGVSSTELARILLGLKRESFWDAHVGPGLLRGVLFRKLLDELLPVRTFEECRVPLAVSVFDVLTARVRAVDSGLLAPALQASCTVPLLFRPVSVSGRPCLDGGITDRPGLAGMPAGGRLLFHHLVSRSPWRRFAPASLAIPRRANATTLVIESLPRVGPFRLSEGARAYEVARARTKLALGREVSNDVVRV